MKPMRKISLLDLTGKILMVYKSLNGLAPDYLKTIFTDRSAISTYFLRNCKGNLAVPRARTNFQKKNSFSYSGAVL